MLLRLTCILGISIQSATAVPVQSRQPAGNDTAIQTAGSEAYQKFLESQPGVATASFYALPAEEAVVFSGSGNSTASNPAMFSSVDNVLGNVSFSSHYLDFLADLGQVAQSSQLDKPYGENASIVETAISTGESIRQHKNPSTPGNYLMNVSANGTTVPYYAFPSLDSTVGGWKASSDAPSAISVTSQTGVTVTVSFAGIGLVDVQRGAWFDNFQSAKATENLGNSAPETAVFAQYFGTAQNPGSLARYNDKMLVAYKPKAVLSFASQSGEVPSMTTPAHGMWGGVSGTATGDGKLTFESNTTDPFIVGFVMRSYWDAAAPSSNSTIGSPSR